MADAPTPDEVRARLREFRARRGYLLPHQGAMAAALPELQDAYGVMYRALTLEQRHLSPFEKEFVWLAILICCEEHVGTHHVRLFYETGGTERQAEAAFRLAAWAGGSRSFAFLGRHWQGHFPDVAAARAYREGAVALLNGLDVPEPLARLALIGVHAARAERWGLAAEIEAAYALGVEERKMAEAMSLAMWPAGVNRFLEACGVWLHVMRSGRVTLSPSFRAWAETPDQDGLHLPPRAAARRRSHDGESLGAFRCASGTSRRPAPTLGPPTMRRCAACSPPPELTEELRRYYGPVFPGVQAP